MRWRRPHLPDQLPDAGLDAATGTLTAPLLPSTFGRE
jgi:hypothetical protein